MTIIHQVVVVLRTRHQAVHQVLVIHQVHGTQALGRAVDLTAVDHQAAGKAFLLINTERIRK